MALVYRVEELHPRMGQVWAMKELRPSSGELDPADRSVQLFRHEAAMLAELDHPNLPKVVDYFDEDGRAYLVMEFIAGRSLEKQLEVVCSVGQGPGLKEESVLPWMAQVCDVLSYLHGCTPPIIFRDLKPSNIMLSHAGLIKLIDFGIARSYKSGQVKDTFAMGSENYAAPEQWGHGQTDARSDIYALGATMYHLLTGQPPPMSFLGIEARPPRQLVPGLSAITEQLILTAMARERADRFQSAVAMRQAITEAVSDLGFTVNAYLDEYGHRNCPACCHTNRAAVRFCTRCGVPLGADLRGVIVLVGETGPLWEVPLAKDSFLIGRKSDSDSIDPDLDLGALDKRHVSRRHAQIVHQRTGFAAVDLGSVNGTKVNGQSLAPHTPCPLHSGDRLTIGQVDLVFQMTA